MGMNTKIEWCDATWNPWIGCQSVSEGCRFCFARRDFARKSRWADCWGPPESTQRKRTSDANWRKPLAWNRQAEVMGVRRKVLCASLADVFEDAPQVEGWRRELWRLIEDTPWLDWLLLTKRIENVFKFVPHLWMGQALWLANVWMGVSTEDQKNFDERWQVAKRLVSTVPVLFFSCEPLLGKIVLPDDFLQVVETSRTRLWTLVGGESGPNARPTTVEWVRMLRDQCQASGTPFHFKQWGRWLPFGQQPELWNYETSMFYEKLYATAEFKRLGQRDYFAVGRERAGRRLDGREWDESPDIGDDGR